ncbi:hypothetical protein BJX96DRAFT_183779 [Aspergillus floccosus]
MTKNQTPAAASDASDLPLPSGITVIIVGLGIAGLTAAIECHRRGHAVIGLEKKPNTKQFGDTLGLSGNGANVLKRWKNRPILDILGDDDVCRVSSLNIHDKTGTLYHSMPCDPHDPIQGNIIRRSGLLDMLYQEAFSLGLDLRFGVHITEYWETDSSAGVLVGEDKITGDCVIAADGVHSKARRSITDEEITLVPGGVAYRSIFHREDINGLPGTEWLSNKDDRQDVWNAYIGSDALVAISTVGRGKYVVWTCVARWMQPASVAPVLKYVADWPAREKIERVLLGTPPGHCFNHALLTAKPLKRLVSPHGRMILIGDAAHPVLPTLGQGANQGIEDAAVVAICLELGGKADVALALRTTEKLRFVLPANTPRLPRVSAIQRLSLRSIDRSDGNGVAFNGRGIDMQPWIYDHDCIRHAYEEFPEAAASVSHGIPYTPTNVPILCSDTLEDC